MRKEYRTGELTDKRKKPKHIFHTGKPAASVPPILNIQRFTIHVTGTSGLDLLNVAQGLILTVYVTSTHKKGNDHPLNHIFSLQQGINKYIKPI